jgi:hypothetical protein
MRKRKYLRPKNKDEKKKSFTMGKKKIVCIKPALHTKAAMANAAFAYIYFINVLFN